MLMVHKKKTLRNALIDSSRSLGIEKSVMRELADSLDGSDIRPLHMEPEKLLEVAGIVAKKIKA